MKEAKFSTYEKTVLQMLGEDTDNPESHALRKIIDVFPWIVQVVECQFDKDVADAAVLYQHYGINFQNAVQRFHAKKLPPPVPNET